MTRPIPDRVKLALFNLLRGHPEGAVVVDLFAGTGALGLECLSLGAKWVLFVERDRRMAEVLRRNVELLGETASARVIVGDALSPAALSGLPGPPRLVFIDPPYPLALDRALWPRALSQAAAIGRRMEHGGFMMVRTPWPFVRRPERGPSDPTRSADGGHGPDVDRHGLDDNRFSRNRFSPDIDHAEAWDEDQAWDDDPADSLREGSARGGGGGGGEGGGGGGGEASAGGPGDRPEDITLAIEGMQGPETHVYRHTAVHLYSPDQPAGPG